MRVPISDFAFIDLDAPMVAAYLVPSNDGDSLAVWCKHCRTWHFHGVQEGHREAHCGNESPYYRTGYNLAWAGEAGEWWPDPPPPS